MSGGMAEGQDIIAPGTVLAGKYRVARILGQGGMGVVVEARHIALDERVALKFLLPEYATHAEASGRFLREARNAVKIKSEHVARVSDVGTLEGGEPYMVMEFLDGSDLSQLLEKHGPFAPPDAVDYTIQACEAIAEAHSYGIVHRDLKPANMFLTKHADGTPFVKVLDFGISKTMGGGGVEALTRTTAAIGSALYMSPEQMQSTRSVDHRTDIYALGVALYEMLAGKQPFFADTLPQLCAEILTGTPTPLRALRPDVPEHFAWVLEKAYQRDRGARYQSIAEFVASLAPYAPRRSQSAIDRVARMAGMNPPTAGAPPVVPPTPGTGAAPDIAQGPLVIQPGMNPQAQVLLKDYAGPASLRAAAAFAGGGHNTDLTTSSDDIPKTSAKPLIFAGVGVGILVIGGAIAFFATRTEKVTSDTSAASSASAPPVIAASPTSALAPTIAPIAPPTPLPPPVTVAASTAPAASPTPFAPSVKSPAPARPPTGKPAKAVAAAPPTPAPQPAPPPPPPPPGKKTSVFDDR